MVKLGTATFRLHYGTTLQLTSRGTSVKASVYAL
jgi:hypothetical protein